ncbi:unnamed protein product [Euphydryas editha]|uniref:Uncharacterized protein n=1 Tax=Euphydryas editha TaxID=104508 RepID=A0AAU9TVF0_EUPED|nr:unnamed protein product [Euphydryas editha]
MDPHHKLNFIQCNTDRSKNAFHEFLTYFHSSEHNIALVSEPYTGAKNEVKQPLDLTVFQFSKNNRVKSCIIAKPNAGSLIGISEFSSHQSTLNPITTNPTHYYSQKTSYTRHPKQHIDTTFLYKSQKAHWTNFKDTLLTNMTNTHILDTQIDTLNHNDLEHLIEQIIDMIHTACKESMTTRASGSKVKPTWWSESLETRKRQVITLHRALHAAKRDGRPTDSLASQLQVLKIEYANELRSESTANFRKFCELQTKENVWSLTNRLLKESAPRRPPTTLKIDSSFTTDSESTARALLDNFYPDDSPDTELRHHNLRATTHTTPDTDED